MVVQKRPEAGIPTIPAVRVEAPGVQIALVMVQFRMIRAYQGFEKVHCQTVAPALLAQAIPTLPKLHQNLPAQ
jgi:hypothetical protein